EDWLGKDWFETFLPKQIRREVSHVYNQLMSGKIEPVEYYENPVLTVGGEERLIAWHNSITKDNNGKIIGVLSSGADITERKHAEEALRISEKRQRSLLANLPVGVYRATPDGKLLTANPAMVEMFGYDSEEELRKIPISDLYLDPRKRQKLISRLTDEGMVTNFEVYLLRKDGNKIWVAASVRAVNDESGEIRHLDGILQDITDRKTAEEELAKVNINLEAESDALHQKNVALKEILKHIEEEKLIIKRQIANNIDQVLVPALKKVRRHDGTVNKYYYDLFSSGLKDLANNSGDRLHKYAKLSSRELEICNMIKQGVTSKVISNELYITIETVKKHRAAIRRKLGISNKSISLSNFLRNL
ncbi:MAG: PAS domain S-box protein, partial [candidate division Zixibacteria bacterium]|nr:PAS domain S-box protein [candidate division Zixibacteria bacterium]